MPVSAPRRTFRSCVTLPGTSALKRCLGHLPAPEFPRRPGCELDTSRILGTWGLSAGRTARGTVPAPGLTAFGRGNFGTMNGLIRFSLGNPYAVTVMCLALIVLGSLTLTMIPVDILPVFRSPAV